MDGVKVDETYYKGIDYYSEGNIEDELFKIIKSTTSEEYDQIIKEKKAWPLLYHLSSSRSNIIQWYPISKDSSVLEIGAGCGAISGALAEKCKCLTCVDLSKKRSSINAERNKDRQNMQIVIGNWEDVEPNLKQSFDIITLIGVLEYSSSYMNSTQPFHDMLKRAKAHLNKGGKLLIAIENRLGLKYWAGCKEDHVSKNFEGIEGYPTTEGVKTFSKKELSCILNECGLAYKFYYPYPDYKFMTDIYSDDYLPKKGQLNNNARNFDQDRIFLFDEEKVFNSLIDNDMFEQFSNSFFIEAWEEY